MNDRSRFLHSLIMFLSALWATTAAWVSPAVFAQPQQVRIVETIWGFDGRVVSGQFNPLSVLVDNLSDQNIEGRISLRAVSGMVRESGGVLTEPIFLAPNTRRWVQFYPYVAQYSSSWRLSLKTPERTIFSTSLDQPRAVFGMSFDDADSNRVAAVILDRPGMATRQPTSIKHMPSEIFPPYVTGTSGLSVLFLDHVPDWETPRQQSLLSWVRCGGQLHLLRDSNGNSLQFSGVLAPLNEPFSSFNLGSGKVQRHDLQRDQLSDSMVKPLVSFAGDRNDPDAVEQARDLQLRGEYSGIDPQMMDADFLAQMRELTQPEHAWWLIFMLSLLYVGLIFPGCWILSQKRQLHFLTTYGAIAALATLFSLLFLLIGRRGYGESTVMNSLGIARSEDSQHWSLFQLQTLFVVSGDSYLLTDDDQQALLASGNTDEAVDAVVQNGNKASFDTRIPPFSSQSIISRRRVSMPDWELSVNSAEVGASGIVDLKLNVGPNFPRGDDCQYLLLYGQRIYSANLIEVSRQLIRGSAMQTLAAYCGTRPPRSYVGFLMFRQREEDPRTATERFYQESIHTLVQRSLLDDGIVQPGKFVLPADRVRLFVYAPIPESAVLAVDTDCHRVGKVLFVRDILLNQATP